MKQVTMSVLCLLLIWLHLSTEAAVCPLCTCPASYEPICAQRQDNKSLRGFSSRCVLECSNQCRRKGKQFEFLGSGRCGKYRTTRNATYEIDTTSKTIFNNKL